MPSDLTRLPNLAGDPRCDDTIIKELTHAGIDLVMHQRERYSEVPAKITGELGYGEFRFTRAWYYWVVSGDLMIDKARLLYEESRHLAVRAAGHCGNPPPDDVADGKEIQKLGLHYARTVENPSDLDKGYAIYERWPDLGLKITKYHIDTLEGLCYFAKFVKEHCGSTWERTSREER